MQAFRDAAAEHPFRAWGLVPSDPKPLAFLTCMFVHAGWLHLLGNMLFFYLTGPFLEDAYGRPLFAALYVASGVVASLVFIAAFPNSNAPLVGASGAVAGLMGAFLVRFVRAKVRFFYFYFMIVFRTGTVDLPAWIVLPLWFLEQLFFAGLSRESGVAYRAHVGGFAFGFLAALAIKALRIEERFIAPKIEKEISVTPAPCARRGDGPAAARRGRRGARGVRHGAGGRAAQRRRPPRDVAEPLASRAPPRPAPPTWSRSIEEEVRRGDLALALDHWRELASAGRQYGPPALRWRLASALEATDRDGRSGDPAHPGRGRRAPASWRRRRPGAWSCSASLSGPAPPPPRRRRRSRRGTVRHRVGRPPRSPRPPHPSRRHRPPSRRRRRRSGSSRRSRSRRPRRPRPRRSKAARWTLCGRTASSFAGRGAARNCCRFRRSRRSRWPGSRLPRGRSWSSISCFDPPPAEARRVERLLSTAVDPRGLLGRPDLSGLEAFRQVVRAIAAGGGAAVCAGGGARAGRAHPHVSRASRRTSARRSPPCAMRRNRTVKAFTTDANRGMISAS